MTYSDRYIMYLGNDGLALGYYSRFDAGGTDLGNGAFSFSVADGQNDLGSLVNGGLDAAGWQQLGEAYRANGAGQIIGNGHLASMYGGAVFLLPPYPNPKPGPGCWPAWGWQGLPCGGAGRVRFDSPGVQQHTEYMTAEGGYK